MKRKFSRQIFKKNIQISNLIKIRPVGTEFFHADWRTDKRKLELHTHYTQEIFPFSPWDPHRLWSTSTAYRGQFSPGLDRPGHDGDDAPAPSERLRICGGVPPIYPHAFMTRCLMRHRDNLTFFNEFKEVYKCVGKELFQTMSSKPIPSIWRVILQTVLKCVLCKRHVDRLFNRAAEAGSTHFARLEIIKIKYLKCYIEFLNAAFGSRWIL
jgi:hypothetical protein